MASPLRYVDDDLWEEYQLLTKKRRKAPAAPVQDVDAIASEWARAAVSPPAPPVSEQQYLQQQGYFQPGGGTNAAPAPVPPPPPQPDYAAMAQGQGFMPPQMEQQRVDPIAAIASRLPRPQQHAPLTPVITQADVARAWESVMPKAQRPEARFPELGGGLQDTPRPPDYAAMARGEGFMPKAMEQTKVDPIAVMDAEFSKDPAYVDFKQKTIDHLGSTLAVVDAWGRTSGETAGGAWLRGETWADPRITSLALPESVLRGVARVGQEMLTKGPEGAYKGIDERWEQTPEPFPGVKGALEFAAAPDTWVTGGMLKAGGKAAAKVAGKAAKPVGEALEAATPALKYALANEQGAVKLWREGAENAPTFYSQLERVVDAKMPNRARPGDVRNMLNGAGVKPDELKWTGFDDFLAEKAKAGQPVSKQEALDFLAQNKVEVKEVLHPVNESRMKLGDAQKWQLPGGENYRELLLTLPVKRPDALPAGWRVDPPGGHSRFYRTFDEQGNLIAYGETENIAMRQALADSDLTREPAPYRSAHWDEPNVLVNVRFNDRTDAAGKKVLFIEEIQSDWHQAGRKKGYRDRDMELHARSEAEVNRLWPQLQALRKEQQRLIFKPGLRRHIDRQIEEIQGPYERAVAGLRQNQGAVPPAPFAKTWPELILKRMIRWAAENDLNRLAWTTGKQQAERYNLAKHIDELSYTKRQDGQIALTAWKDGKNISRPAGFPAALPLEDVEQYVGKDIAQKIAEGGKTGKLTGLDLAVGGEGMAGFYDVILPETVNKLAKKFGARVGEIKIQAGPEDYIIRDAKGREIWGGSKSDLADVEVPAGSTVESVNQATVHAIDITPSMKEAALSEGFPLFARPEATGAVAGGVYGYGTAPEDATEEEKIQRAALFATGGTMAATALTKGARRAVPGLGVEDVSKGVPESVLADYPDLAAKYGTQGQAPKPAIAPPAPTTAPAIEVGDTIRTSYGNPVEVIGEGSIKFGKRQIPGYRVRSGAGEDFIAADEAVLVRKARQLEDVAPSPVEQVVKQGEPAPRRPQAPEAPESPTATPQAQELPQTAVEEAVENQAQGVLGSPPPVGPKPPRVPLWQQQRDVPVEQAAPAPALQSRVATGEIPPATALPSGRKPGGERNMVPIKPPNDLAKLEAALSRPPEPKPTERKWWEVNTNRFLRAVYDRYYDAGPLEAKTGVPVHTLMQLLSGSAAAGEAHLEKQVRPLLRKVAGLEAELEKYLVLRRAEDILARNPHAKLPGGIDGWQGQIRALEALKAKVGPDGMAKIEEAASEIWRLNDELLRQPRLKEGLLSPEQVQGMTTAHPHYIDWHRLDYEGGGYAGSRQAASIGKVGIEKMLDTGSDLALDQPLARWQAQVVETQVEIGRNQAAQALGTALAEMEKLSGLEAGSLVKVYKASAKTVKETAETGPIYWFKDGEKYVAEVPRVYADLAKGLEAEASNALVSIGRALNKGFMLGTVGANPEFAAFNVLGDMLSAWYREGLHPLSKDYARGWAAALTHNEDWYDAAKARTLMAGLVERMKDVKDVERGGGRRLMRVQLQSPKDALLFLPRLVREGIATGEQATRIATYVKLKGQGLTDLQAGPRVRDVSVDFDKAGNVMRVINAWVPFANAGIQGTANIVRLARTNPKAALARSVPLGVASVIAWSWNQRFETANMVPDYEYQNNWVFIWGEGTQNPDPRKPGSQPEKYPLYITIPKRHAAPLVMPVEAALRVAWGNDDRSALEHLMWGVQSAAQGLSPFEPSLSALSFPLAATGTAIQANYDWYRNRPIVPQSERNRPPELQYGPETSTLAVTLGERFQVSPRLIEFAIRDYFGGVGKNTLWLSDVVLGALGIDAEVIGQSKQRELTDMEQLARQPVINRLMGTSNTAQEQRGWEQLDRATEEARRQFAANPEMRRLGINLGAVGDTVSVGGETINLEPAQRAQYQRQVGEAATKAVDAITAASFYQSGDDELKRKLVASMVVKARGWTREALFADGEDPAARVQEYVRALGLRLEYEALPKYAGLSASEAVQADEIKSFVNEVVRETDKSKSVAEHEALERFGRDGYRLYVRARGGESPQRKRFKLQNPLLKQFWPSGMGEPLRETPEPELAAATR